jgi:hypothetical protein
VSIESSIAAHEALLGQVWPPETGKPVSIQYVYSSRVPSLVQEEETAAINRQRLELHARFLEPAEALNEDGEWLYELKPFDSGAKAFERPVGLASSVPHGSLGSLGSLDSKSMVLGRLSREEPEGGRDKWFKKTTTRPVLYWKEADVEEAATRTERYPR